MDYGGQRGRIMPLTNKQRQEALRCRRAKLGQKRREFYLNDSEKVKVDGFIRAMRKAT